MINLVTIIVIAILVLAFIVAPIFIGFSDRERANIIKYDLVSKLNKCIKPSDITEVLMNGYAKVPIDYALNNQILVLNDKEEDYLIEDITKAINNNSMIYKTSKKIKAKFSNEKNHPYNFLELILEK